MILEELIKKTHTSEQAIRIVKSKATVLRAIKGNNNGPKVVSYEGFMESVRLSLVSKQDPLRDLQIEDVKNVLLKPLSTNARAVEEARRNNIASVQEKYTSVMV